MKKKQTEYIYFSDSPPPPNVDQIDCRLSMGKEKKC